MVKLIVGYNNAMEFKQQAEDFLSACDSRKVFRNVKIPAPSFEVTEAVLSCIPDRDIMHIDQSVAFKIVDKLFAKLKVDTKSKLTEALMKTFESLKSVGANSTLMKNAFVRTVYALNSTFAKLLEGLPQDKDMFWEGELGKYDFITLNALEMLGVNALVIYLGYSGKDFLVPPLFQISEGSYTTRQELQVKKELPVLSNRNQGLNLEQFSDIDGIVDYLLLQNEKPNSVQILGVADRSKYESALNRFYVNLNEKKEIFVVDGSFSNPSYEELQDFRNRNDGFKTAQEILNRYPMLNGTSFPAMVKATVEALEVENQFNFTQKRNFEQVIHIWLIRICDYFFGNAGRARAKTNEGQVPVILIWGSVAKRVEQLLRCLESLPISLVQFLPGKAAGYESATQKIVDLGFGDENFKEFPYERKKLSRLETVAYRAEQEIREVLSGDATRYYQMKQFKEINPIILNTTFEEIDILWKEPAKFRPSFSTAGNIATIPSIFAKINGVKEDLNEYITGIQAKITGETLLMDKFPFMRPTQDLVALDFFKTVYFRDHIDMERVKKSQYYRYGIYSTETQNVVVKAIVDFIENGWFKSAKQNFVYNILEVLLRLPQNVMQMIHNFSFTEAIPKLVVFNPTTEVCSAQDCILILFLKSLGFDVLVYAPTGYRVIEEYIGENLFNEINIGPYNYELADIDLSRRMPLKRKGLFGKFPPLRT